MPRPLRVDHPGCLHHVTNGGLTDAVPFSERREGRTFLSFVAREVRYRRIEILAYCIMTTHFHLLVRSVAGGLSDAMARIESGYTLWFNRRSNRRGPLFRSRFWSKIVGNDPYLVTLVRYIDQNPVAAGMVSHPFEHDLGSARHYARGRGPAWLRREEIEQEACAAAGRKEFDAAAYSATFCTPLPHVDRQRIEIAIARAAPRDETADVIDPEAIRAAIDAFGPIPVRARKAASGADRAGDLRLTLRAGLLRSHGQWTLRKIAAALGTNPMRIHRLVREHERLRQADASYEAIVRATVAAALLHPCQTPL